MAALRRKAPGFRSPTAENGLVTSWSSKVPRLGDPHVSGPRQHLGIAPLELAQPPIEEGCRHQKSGGDEQQHQRHAEQLEDSRGAPPARGSAPAASASAGRRCCSFGRRP